MSKIPKIQQQTVDSWLSGEKRYTVNSRYLGFCYLEYLLISKRKSGPCFNT